ncbi:FimV/HubP family polar landmark protein [Shewanella sedimentimangrovi]|uniref:Pilus assembly protein FimV n=1 Tax=Shewanella sedimentimangrovi TaxID=2814293 RepID=A0ABX7QYQ5_9GAMM|nr:FimV/HubP family polar landmark protein [Shewanella sedimentimangrovi]QSX35938.1 hypothetical protein JYB85_11305 [Shewanella sedimentimangrovi]
MNFRTSYLGGLVAAVFITLAAPQFPAVQAAEPLKITGPDGQTRESQRQYGPTSSADTFWSIAQKVRPDTNVTIYQVMAAIYDANPHAFATANYNSLEKGMILLIPSREAMLAIPKSLAKERAESQDKAWRSGAVVAKPEPAKPAVAEVVPEPEAKMPPKPVLPNQDETVKQLSAKLEEAQGQNLALTDELGRVKDQLEVRNNDVEGLQVKVEELNTRIATLEEALAAAREQNASLQTDNEALKQAQALAQIESTKAGDQWRSLVDSPLVLILGASIPAVLILALVWMFMRRRRGAQESMTEPKVMEAAAVAAPVAAAVAATQQEATDEMAVHLDEDADDSIDSLLDMSNVTVAPEPSEEAEVYVDSGADEEGQSLDDLWAEAMGEQDGEVSDEDLDALMAGLETTEDKSAEPSEAEVEEDLDALLADMEIPADDSIEPDTDESSPALDEQDTRDSIAAELDEELGEGPDVGEEDLDALLAGFDAPAEPEHDAEQEDLSAEIAAELEEELGSQDMEEDLDALLAEFNLPPETEEPVKGPKALSQDELDQLKREMTKADEPEEVETADFDLDSLIEDTLAESEPTLDEVETKEDKNAPLEFTLDKEDRPKANKERDSGFFNDLKAGKPGAKTLEWDSPDEAEEPSEDPKAISAKDISDDDLLAAFAEQEEEGFSLDNDDLSMDEALAALTATEKKKKPARKVEEEDLSSFQKENGFIDIDRLLNEASESEAELEPYPALDVDMDLGEMDSLLGNTSMIDVDDEENSVNAKLDLARAYIEIDDTDSARALLREVEIDGNARQKEEAAALLAEIE